MIDTTTFDSNLAGFKTEAERAKNLMRVAAEQLRDLRSERDKLRKENDILKARLRIADAKFARINGHEGLSALLIPQAE